MSEIQQESRPDARAAVTPGEFVEAMRRLKEWTRLSHRQLSKRAADAGCLLPKSTLIAALSRSSLPRVELVTAFVRACGGDESEADRWVAELRRIATGAEQAAVVDHPVAAEEPGRRRRHRRLVAGTVLLASALLFASAAWWTGTVEADRHVVPAEGAPLHSVPAVASMHQVGRVQPQHRYTVLCRHQGEEARGERDWLLVFAEPTQLTGFVHAHDLPRVDTPECARAGDAVQLGHSLVWQHSKPEVHSQHVGDLTARTGRPENLRHYLTRSGDEYPPGSGRRDWCVVFDPLLPQAAAGFIACVDLRGATQRADR